MASVAGCLGDFSGSSGPRERTFQLTIDESGGSLDARIEPEGDVEGVVQVNVGDTVTFDVVNEAGTPVGVHNHATGEEVVIEGGGESTMEFEASEAMTGRQEVEGWLASDDSGEGGHGGSATTLLVVEVRPRGS